MGYNRPREKATRTKEAGLIWRGLMSNPSRGTRDTEIAKVILKFVLRCSGKPEEGEERAQLDLFYGMIFEGWNAEMARQYGIPESFQEKLDHMWNIISLYAIEREAGNDEITLQDAALQLKDNMQESINKLIEHSHYGILEERDAEIFGDTVYGDLLRLNSQLERGYVDDFSLDSSILMLSVSLDRIIAMARKQFTYLGTMGHFLQMTPEDYEKLVEENNKCLSLVETLLNNREKKNNELIKVLKDVKSGLVTSQKKLMKYSKEKPPVLADVAERGEDPIIELHEIKGNGVGNSMSSRIPMEYTDKKGIMHRVFFTEETPYRSFEEEWNVIIRNLIRHYPECEQIFEKLGRMEINNRGLSREISRNESNFDRLADELLYEDRWKWLDRESKKMSEYTGIIKAVFATLLRQSDALRAKYRIYSENEFALKEGTIARRASAMTDVAEALGYSNLLVNSERVTVKRGNRIVSGVMMEVADLDTVDPLNPKAGNPMVLADEKQFDSKEMLQSLADLQILDYLCNNTDRHRYNFFVRVHSGEKPEDTKFLGVQGIDNDTSFGASGDGEGNWLAKSSDLRVITPKMAKAITELNDATLLDILSKNNILDKTEKKAACQRLKLLQDMIEKGKGISQNLREKCIKKDMLKVPAGCIMTVQEDEWDKLTLDKLSLFISGTANRRPKNLFGQVDEIRFRVLIDKEKTKRGKAELSSETSFSKIKYAKHDDSMNLERIEGLFEDEKIAYKNIQRSFEYKGGNEEARSREFKEMKKSLEHLIEVSEIYEESYAYLSENKDLGQQQLLVEVLEHNYKEYSRQLDIVGKKVDSYLDRAEGRWFKNDQYKGRIEIARDLQKMLKDSKVLREMSLQIKEQNKYAKMDGAQMARYTANKIFGIMQEAMYDKVNQIPYSAATNVKREKGIQALKAQEELWKYSQSTLIATSEEEKQSYKKKEQAAIANLKVILEFEPDLKSELETANIIKKGEAEITSLPPKQALRALHQLLLLEKPEKQMEKQEVKKEINKEEKKEQNKTL